MFFVGLLAYTDMLPVRQPPKTFLLKVLELTFKNILFHVLEQKCGMRYPKE